MSARRGPIAQWSRASDPSYEALAAVCRLRAQTCVAIARKSDDLPQLTHLTAIAAVLEAIGRKLHVPASVTLSDVSRVEGLLRISEVHPIDKSGVQKRRHDLKVCHD
jgi:hypothetical protein